MAGQIRAFEYDSLARLTKACNPETGTATCATTPLPSSGLEQYTYDVNGNPLTKTDARGITTTNTGYDALNRPHGRTYPDGTPAVTYTYDQDTKGALSSVSISINALAYSTAYTHDAFGRIKSSTQTTAGQPYVFNYQYSLSDRLKQIQYPWGRTVNYVPDSAGRISAVQNGATLANYATLSYTAPGGISTLAMANGITEQLTWNDRMQVTQLAAGPALTLGFRFCPGSNLPSCPTVNNTGNNGNLRSQTIVAPGLSLTQTYTYDNIDRLTGASETGTGSWNETYHYDGPVGSTYGKPMGGHEYPQRAAPADAGDAADGKLVCEQQSDRARLQLDDGRGGQRQ